MPAAIEVRNLSKSFKGGLFEASKGVLDRLSFQIESNKTTGFIGVNGAGKTTTLKCVLGFVSPDQGEVFMLGESLSSQTKTKIGYLPERPYYYDFLTAKEFLRFHWELSSTKENINEDFDVRALEVLRKVNLKDVFEKKLRSFSKGMLQRIGVAQALLRHPQILILDEPMSGLDPDGRILIKDIILEEKKRGTTVFFSSHLLGDMEELCDNLVVIDSGRLVYSGSLQEFSGDRGVEKSFRDIRLKLGEVAR